MSLSSFSPALSPHGRLRLLPDAGAPALEAAIAQRLQHAFEHGTGYGLLQLGAAEVDSVLPPALSYFRDLAQRYVTAVCTTFSNDARDSRRTIAPPPEAELAQMARAAPPMPGAEYVSAAVLTALWHELDAAFAAELSASKLAREDFLKHKNPAWNLVGRVHFNLAEHRKDAEAPFAFLASD